MCDVNIWVGRERKIEREGEREKEHEMNSEQSMGLNMSGFFPWQSGVS